MRTPILVLFLAGCVHAQSGRVEKFIEENILDPALKNAGVDPASSDAVNAKRLGFAWLSPTSTDAEIQEAIEHIRADVRVESMKLDAAPSPHALACSMIGALQACGCDHCESCLFADSVAFVVLDYDTGQPLANVNAGVDWTISPRNFAGVSETTDESGFVSYPAGNWKNFSRGTLTLFYRGETKVDMPNAASVTFGLYFIALRVNEPVALRVSRNYCELARLCGWGAQKRSPATPIEPQASRECCGLQYSSTDSFCSKCGKPLRGGDIGEAPGSPAPLSFTASREKGDVQTIAIDGTEFDLGVSFGLGVGVYFKKHGEDWQGTPHLGASLQGYLGDSDRYSAAADQPRSGFESAAGKGADGRSVTRDPLLAGSAYSDSECTGRSRKFLAVSTEQQPVWYDTGDIELSKQGEETLHMSRTRTALVYKRGTTTLRVTIARWTGEASRSMRTAQAYPGTECGVYPQEITVVVEVLNR